MTKKRIQLYNNNNYTRAVVVLCLFVVVLLGATTTKTAAAIDVETDADTTTASSSGRSGTEMTSTGTSLPREHRTMLAGGYSAVEDLSTNERVALVVDFAVSELIDLSDSPREETGLPPYSFLVPAGAGENDAATRGMWKGKWKGRAVRGFQQVVAGMNYRLVIMITTSYETKTEDKGEAGAEGDDVIGGFAVTVYDRFGDLSVTKWGKEIPKDRLLNLMATRAEQGRGSEEAASGYEYSNEDFDG